MSGLLRGKNPGRPQPSAPILSPANCTDLSIPAKDLIDRMDYELSKTEYLGDAFPFVNLNSFGPGVVAAFLGADLDNSTGRVWFHPKEILPIEDLHFEYDPNNIWLNRIKEICRVGMEYWQGQVLIGMPDLGGTLDILASFRPGELLMMDLYDDPEEVQRLVWEIHHLWIKYYNEINQVLQPVNPGYCDWATIYSPDPSYVLQSDASYMISPTMFEGFVKPELIAMCQTLSNTMYHLDGIGQLNHLDSLLTIPELNAVQWIPGDGQKPQTEWPEVLQKIHDAGKNLQLVHNMDGLDCMINRFGSGKGIHQRLPVRGDISEKEKVLDILKRYGVSC